MELDLSLKQAVVRRIAAPLFADCAANRVSNPQQRFLAASAVVDVQRARQKVLSAHRVQEFEVAAIIGLSSRLEDDMVDAHPGQLVEKVLQTLSALSFAGLSRMGASDHDEMLDLCGGDGSRDP